MAIIVSDNSAPVARNYGWLKQAVERRLARSDLADYIPDFISLGESRIYYGFKDVEVDVRPLRVREMLALGTQADFSLSALPDGFLGIERFVVSGSDEPLTYVTPSKFSAARAGQPRHYTFENGGISVEGGTPAEFTISYYAKFPALVADADTNWLLQNHPNIYLYSALIEAYHHVKNDSRVVAAARMYAAAANAASFADEAERYSGSPLRMRVEGVA